MEYVRAARLVTREVRAYINDVFPLLQDTVAATATAILLHFRLLHHLLLPVFHLILQIYRFITPSCTQIAKLLYRGFVAQPSRLLEAEAALFAALLALLLLERRFRCYARLSAVFTRTSRAIARSYKTFHSGLRHKSRIAAAALPHLVFCAVAAVFHTTLARFLAPFITGTTVVLLVCVRPAISTVRLLYTVDEELEHVPNSPTTTPVTTPALREEKPEATGNTYETTVLRRRRKPANQPDTEGIRGRGLISETSQERTVADTDTAELPTTQRSTVPPSNEKKDDDERTARAHLEVETLRFWVVFGLIWAVRTTTWYFCPPFLTRLLITLDTALLYIFLWLQLRLTRGSDLVYSVLAGMARQRWKLQKEPHRVNALLRLSVATGLLSPDRAETLASTFTESGFALIGLVFLITPRLATFLGTVLVGSLVPCYLSMGVLERGKGDRHSWLSYWGVYSLFDATFTAAEGTMGWMPLWYHAKMLTILWLQIPYYRGCVTVLDWCMRHVGVALSTVRKQVVTPRKRKRA